MGERGAGTKPNRSLRQLRFLFGHTFWTIKARGKPKSKLASDGQQRRRRRQRRRRPSPKKPDSNWARRELRLLRRLTVVAAAAAAGHWHWLQVNWFTAKSNNNSNNNTSDRQQKFQAKVPVSNSESEPRLRAPKPKPKLQTKPEPNTTKPNWGERQAACQWNAARHHTEFGGNDSGTCSSCSGSRCGSGSSRRQSPKKKEKKTDERYSWVCPTVRYPSHRLGCLKLRIRAGRSIFFELICPSSAVKNI